MIDNDQWQWTTNEMPCQHGRVAVLTGANSAVGFEVARVLATRGATVVLAVRDLAKGKQTARRIAESAPSASVTVQLVDLTSLESIRQAAHELRENHPRIDLLINSAALMFTPKGTTKDGFELQFGTNHLGHFALTGLLLENMLSVAGSRVVNVSSIAHRLTSRINFDDLQWERSYDPIAAYAQSKLANLIFTYELQRRLRDCHAKTITVAAHPGNAQPNLFSHWPAWARRFIRALAPFLVQSAPMGALAILRAATDPSVRGGQYYGPDGFEELTGYPVLVKSSPASHNQPIQRFLWTISEHLTDIAFPTQPVLAANQARADEDSEHEFVRDGILHVSAPNRNASSKEIELASYTMAGVAAHP